jgi:hypothetical protein
VLLSFQLSTSYDNGGDSSATGEGGAEGEGAEGEGGDDTGTDADTQYDGTTETDADIEADADGDGDGTGSGGIMKSGMKKKSRAPKTRPLRKSIMAKAKTTSAVTSSSSKGTRAPKQRRLSGVGLINLPDRHRVIVDGAMHSDAKHRMPSIVTAAAEAAETATKDATIAATPLDFESKWAFLSFAFDNFIYVKDVLSIITLTQIYYL